ncbi:MAG: PD-(D/E)XK nuclease family protein [Actinomycetota bacterium]
MSIPVTLTPYGAAAHEALAAEIARLKAGDPLRPVSVLVANNQLSVGARRALGRRDGVAAVTFLTPYRLAELLGSAAVAASGRRPVSTPVLAGAVRAVLADAPGQFAGVARHPATERSLVRAHRALSEVGPVGLDRLLDGATARLTDVVRVHRAVGDRLRPRFSDEQDLVRAAVEAIPHRPPVLADLGPAIVFLPQRLTSSQAHLLQRLGEHHEVSVVAGVTGADDADAAVVRSVRAIGADITEPPVVVPAIADEALSVSDADDEVRHAVRAVVAAARDRVPLGRVAVLYGNREPYARLIGDALDAADIPWFGTSVRTADTSLLGRSLLALLALPDHDLSRHDVAAWLAGAPVRGTDNRPAPVAAWERAARSAGVIAGLDQWQSRLGRHADDLEADAERAERDDENDWRAEKSRREAATARELIGFVTALDGALKPGGQGASWSGLAAWCRTLVRTYLGGESLRTEWPPEEQAAAQRIDAAIDRLGDLDGIDPDPSPIAFRRALELQLADDLGRHGSFGNGVLVGSVNVALGLELDRVVVVGMAEGSLPARRRDDPLIPDRARTAVGPDLPQRSDRVDDDHRALLAVMAAAEHVTFSFPRGDLRRSAERAPSRWLLDTTEARDGVRPSAEDLVAATGPWLREVPSFIAGLRATPFPASVQEYDVRSLLDHTEAGLAFEASPIPAARVEVGRGASLLQGRLSRAFTRFDGNLATAGDLRGARLPDPTERGHVTSATRLESWAVCPHAYFVRHVLGVAAVEDPEEQYRISPLTRGSLIHDALDAWIAEAITDGQVPDPGRPWSPTALDRLREIAEREADRMQSRGLVGRRVYWGRDRQIVLRDLETFARFDQHQRAAHSSRPIATELPFGMPDSTNPPVPLALPDGRSLTVRGAIDRVDLTHDGTVIVIDYKTGSTRGYGDVSADDPTPGGTHLQLGLYTAAARRILDRPDAPGRGVYWFVTSRGGFDTVGYDVTPDIEAAVLATVTRIVDGIAAGHFPAHPAVPRFRPWVDCVFCEPDALGLNHQYADWRRIQNDPELAPYIELSGGDRG